MTLSLTFANVYRLSSFFSINQRFDGVVLSEKPLSAELVKVDFVREVRPDHRFDFFRDVDFEIVSVSTSCCASSDFG